MFWGFSGRTYSLRMGPGELFPREASGRGSKLRDAPGELFPLASCSPWRAVRAVPQEGGGTWKARRCG